MWGSMIAGLWVSFLTFLRFSLPSIITWILVGLGLSYATYTGFDMLADRGIGYVQSNYDNLPVDFLTFAAVADIPDAISIILSAYVTSVGIKSVATLTKWNLRNPNQIS